MNKPKTPDFQTPRRKHREKVPWPQSWQWYFGYDTKSKSKQGGLYQIHNLCTEKTDQQTKNSQQNEKATYGMWENICKYSIYLINLWETHTPFKNKKQETKT